MGAPAPYAFPEVLGLQLEPMTAAHLDQAAQLTVEAGLEQPCDGEHCQWDPGYLFEVLGPLPPCPGPLGHVREQLEIQLERAETTWCLALTFQGQPLQFEIVRLDDAPAAATIDRTVRATRERPDWFWREVHRPLIEALAAVGVQRVDVWLGMQPDRAWREFYQAELAAVKSGDWDRGSRVKFFRAGGSRWAFPIDLARFTGWPARTVLGFDQTDGRVRVWEATAADLPALRQLIDQTVPIARKAVALRMVDEWWHLDRATVLLGARDGALRYARAIRHRRDTQGGLAFLSGFFDEPELEGSAQLVLAWAKQAGYTTLSIFARPAALTAGAVPRMRQLRKARVVKQHTHFREPFVELEFDV